VKTNLFAPIKAIKFIFSSLTPLVITASTLVIISASLIIYDQIKTYQDRQLGSELIKNLKAESACSQTVKASEKVDVSFTFNNQNSVPITLQQIQVENVLLGAGERKFLEIAGSNPAYSTIGGEGQHLNYHFNNVDVKGKSDLPLTLTFQATSKEEASAKPHTFVIYSGKIIFDFEHQMTIEAPCDIQVIYAD